MKKGSHKNQIIITTLALLLAVVGYISYDNRDTFMNAKDVLSTEIEAVNGKADTKESKECEDTQASDEVALETDSTEEILNAGETVLTSASTCLLYTSPSPRAGALKEQGGSAEDYR